MAPTDDDAATDAMDDVFRALADPSRRALLDSLDGRNGQTLRALCAGLAMARQSVSKHLAVLEAAGLVTTQRHGREKHHFLDAAPINAIADRWISHYDRRRAAALADLKTALEHTTMTTTPTTATAPDFVYTTFIATTPERLWQALTERSFTERYWGVALTSDWTVGSAVTWEYAGATMAEPGQTVLVADPPRTLSYTWHVVTPDFIAACGGDETGEFAVMAREPLSRVTFEIEPVGAIVKLTVTHGGFEVGSAVREGVSQGWPSIISSLKTLLETGAALPEEG
jgi:DNA-binding transcriptional ArsR family regulator/uncharacterized protein YndB with AHSA1/START domain